MNLSKAYVRRGVLLLSAVLLAPTVWASDDGIATDRPDFVESGRVVGHGRLQIETSLAVERDGDVRVRATPTLLRYGIGDMLELRLESDGMLRMRDGMARTSGMADTAIGMKWQLNRAEDDGAQMALLAHLDLPSGASALRGEGVRPSLRLVAEWELSDGFALGVMPGLMLDRSNGRRQPGAIFGLVLGKSWNEQWRSFIELAMPRIATTRHGGTEAALNVGAAWLLSPSAQLDVAFSRRLNRNGPERGATVGLSLKY